jgi:uncharacterized protein
MTTSTEKTTSIKVIMDSNSLFVPLQFKIDIFTELEKLLNKRIEPILLSPVKKELELLASSNSPKIRKNATFALNLAKKCAYIKIPIKKEELTDDAIVRIAKKWNSPVFTNDKALKKKLRDISMPVIYVRQKSHLEING